MEGKKKKTLTYFPSPRTSRYRPGWDAVTSHDSEARWTRRPSHSCPAVPGEAGSASHGGGNIKSFFCSRNPLLSLWLGLCQLASDL